MKKIIAVGLAVAGIAWVVVRRNAKPADTWAQASDTV